MIKKILFLIFLLLTISINIFGVENITSPESKDFINIKADNVEYTFKEGQEIGIFTGNVNIQNNGLEVYGDKVNLYTNEKKLIGEGNIKIINEDAEYKFTITGGKCEFNNKTQYANVINNPHLVIVQKTKNNSEIVVKSEQMEMFFDKNEVKFNQNVNIKIIQNKMEAWSNKAIFYSKEKKLVMTENAKVSQEKNIFSAEEIIFYMDDNKIIMKNNVSGTVIQKPEQK